MDTDRLDLADLLRFDAAHGRIWLEDYRMVLLSACALGALRRELVETVGLERARGILKRFGHAAGLADGHALAELFPQASRRDQHEFGPALHGLEGIAKVVFIDEASRFDPEHGHCHVEAYWENSYEAEQHVELFGRSDEPVCWTLVGYARGHSSSAAGRPTVVYETECKAMGHPRCRFVLDYVEALPEAAAREDRDYEQQHLPKVLQELADTISRQKRSLRAHEREISSLRSELASYRAPTGFVGDSPEFEAAVTTAHTVAPVDATVLFLGESGTGKELLARFVHDRSLRRDRPFVALNCSALPETLQEAELFGYAKGAFTGASAATQGVFEAAHRGTLFLDEIGDLSPSAQTKILRALQEGEVKRLGETRTRRVDVRVIAATHRDLRAMIDDKAFREDLFYRLSVVTIEVPPLRERGIDKLLLAEHFVTTYAAKFGRPARELTHDAKEAIASYDWPGNVRELQHAVERAVILARGATIGIDDLPDAVRRGGNAPRAGAAPAARERIAAIDDERERIATALELAGGNRERAAQSLGMSRTTLWRRMRALGVPAPAKDAL